ncbi:MAG: hypothetical protein J5786_04255 [Clostridiales bacterium]|nr:hypothetical protein [Clostridiales bacterium]
MIYQQSGDKTAYAKEAANVMSQLRQLHGNPGGKLKNHFLIHLLYTIFVGIFVLASFGLALSYPGVAFIEGALLMLIFFFILRLSGFSKAHKQTVANQDGREIGLDAKGITSSRSGCSYSVTWENIRCIRKFRYTMLILPVNIRISAIILPVENFESVKNFITENGIDVQILEG